MRSHLCSSTLFLKHSPRYQVIFGPCSEAARFLSIPDDHVRFDALLGIHDISQSVAAASMRQPQWLLARSCLKLGLALARIFNEVGTPLSQSLRRHLPHAIATQSGWTEIFTRGRFLRRNSANRCAAPNIHTASGPRLLLNLSSTRCWTHVPASTAVATTANPLHIPHRFRTWTARDTMRMGKRRSYAGASNQPTAPNDWLDKLVGLQESQCELTPSHMR